MAHEFFVDRRTPATYDQLLAALMEHEGHSLRVERIVRDEGSFEVQLKCTEKRCEDNPGIIFLPISGQIKRINLTFEVRSWFPEEMPGERELAQGIDDGLSREWHSPDSGDGWWVEFITAQYDEAP